MKVIFLDIDGVLNWTGTKDKMDGFVGLDPVRIERFNRILDAHPEAKIVISSTWRYASAFQTAYKDFAGLKRLLKRRGLKGKIIGHTPMHFGDRGRGNEIREWLADFESDFPKDTLEAFVVLDDDNTAMAKWRFDPTRHSWESEDDFDERHQEWQRVVDLRPHHVRTSFTGQKGNYGGFATEGGLLDTHIDDAINVLNGKLFTIDAEADE